MYEDVSSINSSEQQTSLLKATMKIRILQKAGGLSEQSVSISVLLLYPPKIGRIVDVVRSVRGSEFVA